MPDLKIVIDHLPQMSVPTDPAILKLYKSNLAELSGRPKVYIKISEVLQRVNGQVLTELAFYQERLDELYQIFGEDRVLYGSDWPNSDQWLPVENSLKIVQEYFMGKGRDVAEKFFWKNSIAAYSWQKRSRTQPG